MRALPAVFALGLLLAGCLGAPAPEPLAPGAAPPLPALPMGLEPFAALRCADDRVEALVGRTATDCNTKVTVQNGPAAEVHLAVNPRDPLNLVGGAKDFTLGEDARCGKYSVWSGVYASFDGGRTWSNGLLPGHPGDARRTNLSAYACGSDPVLAFGPEGYVYYAGIYGTHRPGTEPILPQLGPIYGYESINASLAVTRSRDGGRTWDEPVLLRTLEGQGIIDKEWIATDPATGQVYVSYIDAGDGVLKLQRSDDQGLTWTEPIVLHAPGQDLDDGRDVHQFGQVAVGPGSVVHYTFWSVREEPGHASGVYHIASRDGGATWSAPVLAGRFVAVLDLQFTHKYRIVTMPALAVDPASGALAIAYPNPAEVGAAPRAQADLDIFVVRSTDEGATWSAPVRVNDDLLGPLNGQWMPALAFGPDGALHATWLDYRDDPAGQFAYVYYAFSTDGGATWSPNARLSDAPFDGTGGYHQSGAGTIGDYMGLAASPQAVHAFWADTREGRNDVFAAAVLAR